MTRTTHSPDSIKPITVEDALQILTATANGTRPPSLPITLAVCVFRPGAIGGTPVSRIVNMAAGFDWDSSLMLLTPEQPLTTLTSDDVAAIRTSAKAGQSWHAYQAHKRSAEQIKELKKKIVALTAERTHLLDAIALTWSPSAVESSEELHLGSNLAGAIRSCPDGTFEARCTLPGSTLASTGHPSAEAAKQYLQKAAAQWLTKLLG